MDAATIRRLLLEGEGSHLDYKEAQYVLTNGAQHQKAEIVKDVLAMANSWRTEEAFILTGIRERVGEPAEICGLNAHLDDADLQELVNKKTNRPIAFKYAELDVDGLSVGVLCIAVQRRPFYLTSDFGPLKAGIVYVRRGSSTGIATPDEVIEIGLAESSVSATPWPLEDETFREAKRQYEGFRSWPGAHNAIRALLVAGAMTTQGVQQYLSWHGEPSGEPNLLELLHQGSNLLQRAYQEEARVVAIRGEKAPFIINPAFAGALAQIVKDDQALPKL
jgi:hypothetical protein